MPAASVMLRCLILLSLSTCTLSWTSSMFLYAPSSEKLCFNMQSTRILPTRSKGTKVLLNLKSRGEQEDSFKSAGLSANNDIKNILLIGGLGNTATIISREAAVSGYRVIGTSRQPEKKKAPERVEVINFADSPTVLKECTHLLLTAPPEPDIGDPFLASHSAFLSSRETCPNLQWIGYLSSTGVYGNRDGGIVDEHSETKPTNVRSIRRVPAEDAWRRTAAALDIPLDIFRCGGIYADPSYNSTFDLIRAGTARRITAPGHSFPRIHVTDVARGVLAAAAQHRRRPAAARVLNLVDDSLCTPASDVVGYAAELLGFEPPLEIPLAVAWETMSPGLRSFWGEDVKVRNEITKKALSIEWRYPTYKEGMQALLEDERARGKWCGPGRPPGPGAQLPPPPPPAGAAAAAGEK